MKDHGPHFFIKRDDLIHSHYGGNKYRKLCGYLEDFRLSGKEQLITVGGAWSNHLHATAHYCQLNGIKSIGLVKYHCIPPDNWTLQSCLKAGMKLRCLPRQMSKVAAWVRNEWPNSYFIPEGGQGMLGTIGVEAMLEEVTKEVMPTHIIVSVGMGATLTGILRKVAKGIKVIGVSSFGLEDYLMRWPEVDISALTWFDVKEEWGRFGSFHPDILKISQQMQTEHDFPLDPIYTAKTMLKTSQLMRSGYFSSDDQIVFIHTGGLQGWHGWRQRYATQIRNQEHSVQ